VRYSGTHDDKGIVKYSFFDFDLKKEKIIIGVDKQFDEIFGKDQIRSGM